MKKFLTVVFVIIAAMILVSCSGKNLDDLIDVPDTGDSADSSATSEQNDTDNGGDTNADTADSTADTGDSTTDTGDSNADTGDSTTDTGDSGNENDADSDSDDVEVSDIDMSDNDQEESGDDADSSDSDNDNDKDPADSGDDSDTTDSGDDKDPADSGDESDPADSGDDSDTTDSGDDNDTDSGENQQKCTEITLINADQLSYNKESSTSHVFKTTYTPNTGSNDNLYIKIFGSYTDNYSDNYSLAGTNWKDDKGYNMANGVFVYVYENEYCDYNGSNCSHSKMYFQRKGNVDVSSMQVNNFGTNIFYADLDGVELEEVSINGANQSIPKEGGECLKIKDTEVHYQWY